jgi:hypothetical protein
MGIADFIDRLDETPMAVDLPEHYLVKWTKQKIQYPDAKCSFIQYVGNQEKGNITFFMKESDDSSYNKLDIKLCIDFGDGDDDFTILSDHFILNTQEECFELAEKINKAFNNKKQEGNDDSKRTI